MRDFTAPRKVHFHHDQEGATFGLKKTPFANTLCKMNSEVPESHITTDPDKVTCKICRKDHRFAALARKRNINEAYGKMASAYPPDLMPHLQMYGRALRPNMLNGARIRYRRNWRGKLILQVEVFTIGPRPELKEEMKWRDATLSDLGGGVV